MKVLDRLRRRETLEPVEQAALEQLLAHASPGDLFLDVGAYHGAYARAAAARGLAVLCFEADARNARWLRDFEVVRAVVSEDTAPVTFAARGSQVSGAADLYHSPRTRYVVSPAVTLDGALLDYETTPRLLKLDVEGFEAKVLRGASAVLATISAVLVEIHPAAMRLVGDDPEDVRQLLHGFDLEVLDENPNGGRAHWLGVRRP